MMSTMSTQLAVVRSLPERSSDPAGIYLANLDSPASRDTMTGCLDRITRLRLGKPLNDTGITAADMDWSSIDYELASAIREAMTALPWKPSTLNKHLCAFRKVIEEAWKLGMVDTDTYMRIQKIAGVKATRLPVGRAISADEIAALMVACDDGTAKGARDGAAIGLMYSTGARRSEVVALTLADWNRHDRQFQVVGKGNKERLLSITADVVPWLNRWMRIRGWDPGRFLCPTFKGGAVRVRPLSGQALRDVLIARCEQAGVQECTPHDFRRTLVGDLLSAGVDLATVQEIAGHASPTTTARYDRRGSQRMLEAVDRLHFPQPKETA